MSNGGTKGKARSRPGSRRAFRSSGSFDLMAFLRYWNPGSEGLPSQALAKEWSSHEVKPLPSFERKIGELLDACFPGQDQRARAAYKAFGKHQLSALIVSVIGLSRPVHQTEVSNTSLDQCRRALDRIFVMDFTELQPPSEEVIETALKNHKVGQAVREILEAQVERPWLEQINLASDQDHSVQESYVQPLMHWGAALVRANHLDAAKSLLEGCLYGNKYGKRWNATALLRHADARRGLGHTDEALDVALCMVALFGTPTVDNLAGEDKERMQGILTKAFSFYRERWGQGGPIEVDADLTSPPDGNWRVGGAEVGDNLRSR